jgi:hypothetical protein
VAAWAVFAGTRAVLRLRGARIVTCPETEQPVAVDVDVRYAVAGALVGRPELRLRDCSRWPERAHCGQECLGEIAAAPDDCLVRNIVARWYGDKTCVYCRRPIGVVQWHDRKPALRGRDGKVLELGELPVEGIPEALREDAAVCANCADAELLRQRHPELVVERPPRPHAS